MASELAHLILDNFVQRRDVFAVQSSSGAYRPVYQPLDARLIDEHLAGNTTVGHYLADSESKVRVICFDVDLEKEGVWMEYPDFSQMPSGLSLADEDAWTAARVVAHPATPRTDWLDRAHPGRAWYKQLLRTFADELRYRVSTELELPSIATYSGSKGVHVYALLGEATDAAEARAGAQLVLRVAEVGGGKVEHWRGKNFYKVTGGAPWAESASIEIFPKQDSMEGKKLGNLVRLPLGRNQKTIDPTFVIDHDAAPSELVSRESLPALRGAIGVAVA